MIFFSFMCLGAVSRISLGSIIRFHHFPRDEDQVDWPVVPSVLLLALLEGGSDIYFPPLWALLPVDTIEQRLQWWLHNHTCQFL